MWGTLLATSLAYCGPKAYHLTIEKSSSNTMISSFYATVQIKYEMCNCVT